ncbi:MAG: hypothetical protein EOO75_07940 [Myxococcales bacterium]|nr:MAG: hypothetical protein EOO75_07940 [Myxococcales bacterium]
MAGTTNDPLRTLAEAVRSLGVQAVSADEARAGGDALREHYAGGWPMGVLWSPALWEACRERVERLQLWATMPEATLSSANDVKAVPSFLVDPERPEQLWYAPSTELPAALFVPVAARPEAIAQALRELGPATTAPTLDEVRTVRAYMGSVATQTVPSPYTGEMEAAGPHELDRHFSFSPVVTPHAWGSAFGRDPLREVGPLSLDHMVATLRQLREHRPGGLPRFTRRSYFSQSHVGIEIHAQGQYFWHIDYRPSPWTAGVIESFNRATGYQLPADLPVDVAAAVHGFEFLGADWLEAALAREADPGQRGALVSVALGVASDDLVSATHIARAALAWGELEQIAVAQAAVQYNWEFLLEELGWSTTSPELRTQLERILVVGMAPPELNEHGEPVDLHEGSEDDDTAEPEDDHG